MFALPSEAPFQGYRGEVPVRSVDSSEYIGPVAVHFGLIHSSLDLQPTMNPGSIAERQFGQFLWVSGATFAAPVNPRAPLSRCHYEALWYYPASEVGAARFELAVFTVSG
jgi:hypothetical protein